MSISNENNRSIIVVPLGSPAADITVPAFFAEKKMQVKSVALLNGAGIAASDTDFVKLSLLTSADVEVAELDTRAAHEGAVTAFVAKALNIVSAQSVLAKGSSFKVLYDETDSGTAVALTNAVLVITLHQK